MQMNLHQPNKQDVREQLKARARQRDPETSHIAAQKHDASGKTMTNTQIVLDEVASHPGRTAAEYGAMTGLGHAEAQRRLSGLAKAGKVQKVLDVCGRYDKHGNRRIEIVPCPIKGTPMCIWEAC